MERKIIISGRNVDPEYERFVRESFRDYNEEGKKFLEGEIEKTDRQLKAIQLINIYLKEELDELGLDYGEEIESSRFHFLSDEGWERLYPNANSETTGYYRSGYEAIHLKKSRLAGLLLFSQMLHELIHLKSFQKLQIDREDERLIFSRGGYHISYSNEETDQILRGLNEAMVQLIARKIWRKHRESIIEQLGIAKEEIEELERTDVYFLPMNVMTTIMDRIAKAEEIDLSEVWLQFERGFFEGKMMHLRKIEKLFGPKSLKIISLLENRTIDKDGLIQKYFLAETEVERAVLRDEILGK